MSLQRRLLVYLLLSAPLVWLAAVLVSADRARHEVNELYDTEIIRLALQVQATLGGVSSTGQLGVSRRSAGEADLRDLAIAVWNGEGKLLLGDQEGVQLPRLADASGFVDMPLHGEAWRVYYLQSPGGEWLVAAGQLEHEREELVWDFLSAQLLPWLLVLPLLLGAMAWAVRQALAPVRAIASDLQERSADDLHPLAAERAPVELRPLLGAMNGLFARIEAALERERRFTADAAHELRTPLAALRAQWDVLKAARDDEERRRAEARLSAGLDRLDRLVTQMLALSRLESTERLERKSAVAWAPLVEQAMGDVLALAERRRIELECEWPPGRGAALPIEGDADLLGAMLRNLLDNAVRYAPEGSLVTLRFDAAGLSVENAGPAMPAETLAQLGERFRRPDGQAERGSGLGVSIARRVAELHGLALSYRARRDGTGVVAEVRLAGRRGGNSGASGIDAPEGVEGG